MEKAVAVGIAGEPTSLNNDPQSKRGYNKLAAVLREAGEKYPSGVV